MPFLTEDRAFSWIESALGGRVVASTRQGGRESGGRPGWFLTLDRDGARERFYLRGDRGGDFGYTKSYNLQREARILEVLHAEGVPVPRVVLSSNDPDAIVLEFVEGENDFTTLSSASDRDAVAREFAEIMAAWHAIPAEKFRKAGLSIPGSAEEVVTQDLALWEGGHFPRVREPVPLARFACSWLRRNVPPAPDRPVLVQGDTGPGQFIFGDGHVRAIVDWELAHLGDPMRDLAHIRTRDVWYPTGNLPTWFRHYSEASGVPLDGDKLRYYNVVAMATTMLALGPVVQNLDPRDEHAEWVAQDAWSKVATAEALAEATAIGLEHPELPIPADACRASVVFDALEANLRDEQLPFIEDAYRAHRLRMFQRLLAHARNLAEIGPEIEALELDDMEALLGARPESCRAGNRAIDRLVESAGPEMDETLVRYFYRHAVRERALMRGGMGRADGATTSPLE